GYKPSGGSEEIGSRARPPRPTAHHRSELRRCHRLPHQLTSLRRALLTRRQQLGGARTRWDFLVVPSLTFAASWISISTQARPPTLLFFRSLRRRVRCTTPFS